MKRNQLRLTSLLLTIVMIICAFPVTAMATDDKSPIVSDTAQVPDDQIYTDTLGFDNPDIPRPVTEMEARREENVKHFLLPDGTIEAVVYSNAVHRKNASGEWEDIDNTLSGDNAKVPDLYVTDDLRVAFAKTFSAGGQLFALNENGYGISMKLMTDQISTSPMLPITEVSSASTSAAVSTVTVTNTATRGNKKQWDTIDEAITVNNASSIIYTNVRSNTDLEYILDGNNIKENIIVKAASNSYIYTFELGLSGLTPVLCEDGSITLSDSETEETQYIIPAPYMYDANGEVSYEVYYTLTEKSDGAYTLKITANAEWMNAENRTFPVVIDPTVTSDATVDTYINSSSPTSTYGSSNQLWISSTKTTFIKLPTPNYPSGFTITNAYLYVAYYYYDNVTSNSLTAGAYQVNMGWAEGSLSWNGANNYSNLGISTTRLSSASFSGSQGAYENTPKWVRFDITSAATAWNSGTSNNGIALKRESGTNGSVILKSTEAGSYSPYILVHYTEPRVTDGVYKIKNVSTGKYVDVTDSGTASGTQLQQWSGTATDGNRAQLFKITFVCLSGNTNYYTVRPLTNCGQGMNIPALDGTATVNTLQPEESWSGIPWNQSIAIISNGNNYVIKSGGSSSEQYLTAPSSGTNGTKLYSSTLESMSSAWILEPYTTAIDGTKLVNFTPYLVLNETFTYQAVMFSSTIGRNGPPTYVVYDEDGSATDKATINATTGELTALKTGTIIVGATYPGAGTKYWYRTTTIIPSFVQDLIDDDLASYTNISKADDKFYMLTTPLSSILNSAGIYTLSSDSVINYYDDWYIYAIRNGSTYTYSMLKMREKEYDGIDGDSPGVTISFVEFNYQTLLSVINNNTSSNATALQQNLDAVTGPGSFDHSPAITEYFSLTSAYAPYCIAEEYIKFLANTSINGVLSAPPEFVSIINNAPSGRLSTAILQNNTNVEYNIYNPSDHTITISNINSLTIHEKYAILMTHTGNVNFNSFAAEVEFHADAVTDWLTYLPILGENYYERALRADMGVGEENESGRFDDYYDLDSDIVVAQANAHGEY